VLSDLTCDQQQLFLTGDDYDGMLVTVDHVQVAGNGPAGDNFYVAVPGTVART
jgi:hypothetical protein